MPSISDALIVRRGATPRFPFAIVDETNEAITILGGTVAFEVWHPDPDCPTADPEFQFALTDVEIVDVQPTKDSANVQQPHGYYGFSAAQSAALPFGMAAFVKRKFTDSLGRVFIDEPRYLMVDL